MTSSIWLKDKGLGLGDPSGPENTLTFSKESGCISICVSDKQPITRQINMIGQLYGDFIQLNGALTRKMNFQ